MNPHPIIRRTSDGKLFEASYPEWFEHYPTIGYYFRCVEYKQQGWWPFRRWIRTGEIWEPENEEGWEIVV